MKHPVAGIVVLILFGALALINISRTPRFQLIHASEVVQVLGAGMCFGVALAWGISALRKE